MRRTGRVYAVWDLAQAYGFTDVDGRQPHFGRWIVEQLPEAAWRPCDDAFYAYWHIGTGRSEA